MKKLKWILLFIMVLLAVLFLFATCKKTKALESELININTNIREAEQRDYNIVFIFDLGENSQSNKSNFLFINGYYRLAIYNQSGSNVNNVTIEQIGSSYYESFTTDTRLLQVQVVYDSGNLVLIVYNLSYTMQQTQGVEPVIDGVSRSLKTRFVFGQSVLNDWQSQNGLDIKVTSGTYGINTPNFLFNYSYISPFDTIQDINNWVDSQISNYKKLNLLIADGYEYGNTDGYDVGYTAGQTAGYNSGYSAGETAGYNSGYYTGRTEGLEEGEQIGYNQGYNIGYSDGQAGNTAITPVFNTLSGVFSVVGSVLAIELVPNIPLGIFILVPLFFAAIGLILWIWRRN